MIKCGKLANAFDARLQTQIINRICTETTARIFLTLIQITMNEETLKELIKEMELRVTSFEYNRDLNKEVDAQHGYWDGKRSEAAFMVEKLNWILENGGL